MKKMPGNKNEKFESIFHLAARFSLVNLLKDATQHELNTRDDNGRLPIHYAALKGHLNALKVILSCG
jgi:ankyrin repeat protein